MVCCARAMLPPSIITALAPARFRTAVWGQRVFGFAASFFMTVGATSPITATAAKNAVVRGVMISDRDFSDASSNPACATTITVHNPASASTHALRHPCNHRLRTWQLRKLYGMRPMATPTANCGRGTCSWGDATFMNQLGVKGNTRAKIMYTVRCDRLASINLRNSTMRDAKKRATCNGPHQCDKPRRYTHGVQASHTQRTGTRTSRFPSTWLNQYKKMEPTVLYSKHRGKPMYLRPPRRPVKAAASGLGVVLRTRA